MRSYELWDFRFWESLCGNILLDKPLSGLRIENKGFQEF
ncbi:hypothetical protein NIES267_42550 [Calothrix parasitica NIES-267]|uniref:Uncharacterized protein n=1 Tax=Calothrix parasitica NIES-267 TaxID=1973488 RepID=A0A1Z4LUK9_9CYAN|nr:hypothetical protein NIES267_42550 [Calothrix parasitica NIES-267]